MIRSAKDVITIAKERGFGVELRPGPPPMPVLVRPDKVPESQVTDALMNALKAWRLEIIVELTTIC